MNWFRFYSEAIDDKKLRRIARETDSPFACVLGIWTIILSLASESCIRGALMIGDGVPATADDVSDIAGCNVTVTLQKLIVTGLVTDVGGVLYVSSWDKRQYTSDSSADRVRNHRNRQNVSQNGQKPPEQAVIPQDVTAMKRYSNVTVTPPDTDTDTDTEKILTAYAVSALDEQPAPEQATKTKRAAAKKPTDPNMQHPAVIVFRDVAHKFPNHVQAEAIATTVTDVPLWQDTVKRWLTLGWSPVNIDGILARYTGGWADIDTKRNGQSRQEDREPAYKRAIRAFIQQEGLAPNGI